MKPLPPGLPAASSSSWHSRRARDPLGYLRSRSLANPSWRRDMPWLIAYLRRQRPPAGEPLRPCYEAAITAAQRYQRLAAGGADDLDAAWDAVLAPIDDIVVAHHREHLDRVAAAGLSGGQVPPPQR